MSEPLPCMACGVTSHDVRPCLVEEADPAPVTVSIVTAEDRAAVRELAYRTVPGRYAAEYRCTDVRACLSRRPKPKPAPLPEPVQPAEPAPADAPEPVEAGGEDWFA